MSKSFKKLRDKMSPASKRRATLLTKKLLAEEAKFNCGRFIKVICEGGPVKVQLRGTDSIRDICMQARRILGQVPAFTESDYECVTDKGKVLYFTEGANFYQDNMLYLNKRAGITA